MMTGDQAREDQFLGALLGLAIGDAMGRPLRGMTSSEIATTHGKVTRYLPSGEVAEGHPESGEITDKSEVALSLIESLTTNEGVPDPDNMIARLGFIVRSETNGLMSAAAIEGVRLALANDGQVPESYAPPSELAVALRGVPVGLLHSVGAFDGAALDRESEVVAKLTHGGSDQARMCAAVALALAVTARSRQVPQPVMLDVGDTVGEWATLRGLLAAVSEADGFTAGLSAALALGGETDSIGAIAGALLGAKLGASGIPQDLIDQLDARIYLTLASPWFYRTAVRRAGTLIDLRMVD
jgi:ADP-ribosyl-[dinitrogen reductase] hydrolase